MRSHEIDGRKISLKKLYNSKQNKSKTVPEKLFATDTIHRSRICIPKVFSISSGDSLAKEEVTCQQESGNCVDFRLIITMIITIHLKLLSKEGKGREEKGGVLTAPPNLQSRERLISRTSSRDTKSLRESSTPP